MSLILHIKSTFSFWKCGQSCMPSLCIVYVWMCSSDSDGSEFPDDELLRLLRKQRASVLHKLRCVELLRLPASV